MGLSAHEVLLVLRARNEASLVLAGFSRDLRNVERSAIMANRAQRARGQALATLGVGIAAMGAVGLYALNKLTDSAVEYNRQTSLTLTQVDKAHVSFNDLWKIGMKIGTTVPVAFNQIQASLYDIFSSINTDGPGAAKILDAIARAAVGGSTDMKTAGRGIIAILNAYKMPAQQVTKVSDVLFQLVRKGVGTYSEFVSVIGRAVPSALKAGQSIQSLSGMMAFLTRNGLSTAMAAASSARALDALSKTKAIESLHKLGVEVQDTHGRFLPVVDIMTNLRDKLKNLTPVARAVKLNELFKGAGGTIQAMRFFNLAIDDSKGLLKEMTTNMNNAGGAAAAAYKIMSNTPAAKIQLMKNRWHALGITIGNELIPIKLALIDVLSRIVGWFSKLNPHVKKMIAYGLALASALALVLGIVISLVGTFILFNAALQFTEISLLAIMGTIGLVIVAIVAIGVAVYLVIKHWKEISRVGKQVWGNIVSFMKPIVEYMVGRLMPVVRDVTKFFVNAWESTWPTIKKGAIEIWHAIQEMAQTIGKHLKGLGDAFNGMGEAAKHVFNFMVTNFTITWNMLKPILGFMLAEFKIIFPVIARIVSDVFVAIGRIVGAFIDIIKNVIKLVKDLINGDWNKAWHDLLGIFRGIWNLLWAFLSGILTVIRDAILGALSIIGSVWKRVWDKVKVVWDTVWGAIKTSLGIVLGWIILGVKHIVDIFLSMAGTIIHAAAAAFGWIPGLGGKLKDARDAFDRFKEKVDATLRNAAASAAGHPIRPRVDTSSAIAATQNFASWYSNYIAGLHTTLPAPTVQPRTNPGPGNLPRVPGAHAMGTQRWRGGLTWVGEHGKELVEVPAGSKINSHDTSMTMTNGDNRPEQKFYINTQEIDPRVHAAQLGWEMSTRVA